VAHKRFPTRDDARTDFWEAEATGAASVAPFPQHATRSELLYGPRTATAAACCRCARVVAQCGTCAPHRPAEMTALPKVDTNWTAPSLIPTNGNTVRSFSTHGHQSAAKGSSTTVALVEAKRTS
jgi:hypothetical protein